MARVRLHVGGSGQVTVNEKPAAEYFPRVGDVGIVREPLEATETESRFDVTIHTKGGGITGQRDAARMGIARALLKLDPELKALLRKGGYLTRDNREKERKKPGLKRARKAPQYTKR
jgi:small subunit ribosomal protein S9